MLAQLELLGRYALWLLLIALALFITVKSWQRYRFMMQIRMARISSAELDKILRGGAPATLLDVRSSEERAQSGWIPGAIHVSDLAALQLDPRAEVIVYCDCPNEASAAVVARKLKEKGFGRVRPLSGGLAAWRAQGLPVHRE